MDFGAKWRQIKRDLTAKGADSVYHRVMRKLMQKFLYTQIQQEIALIATNLPYEIDSLEPYKKPTVLPHETTIDLIRNHGKSLARFGDGEFNILWDGHNSFQSASLEMKKRLSDVLHSADDRLLVGIPDQFGKVSDPFWRTYMVRHRAELYTLLNLERPYHDASITRVETVPHVQKVKTIWDDRDVLLIEGEQSRCGIGNDLFDNVRSLSRILCPAKNAYAKYDAIFEAAKAHASAKLVLAVLGPTATILCHDLALADIQAVDLGHLDVVYEWARKGRRFAIPGKYTNEYKGGKVFTECTDPVYRGQIVATIR